MSSRQVSESDEAVEYSSNCYEVEAIRNTKIVKGKRLFQVKWKGWDQSTNTWEPLQNLRMVKQMVQDFMKDHEAGSKKNITKKDRSQSNSALQISSELPKKTKKIQKQKQKKTPVIKENSDSENKSMSSQSSRKSQSNKKTRKTNKQQKKQSIKITSYMANSESSKQKSLMKNTKDKQTLSSLNKELKGKDKITQNPKNISISKNQSKKSIIQQQKPTTQLKSYAFAPKQPQSKIIYTRINYHVIIDQIKQNHAARLISDNPRKGLKLFYNVDRRDAQTKRPLPVLDISSQDLRKIPEGQDLVIDYLQNYIKSIEYIEQDEKQYYGATGIIQEQGLSQKTRLKMDSFGRQAFK